MAESFAVPTISVSPAVGGTATYALGTSGMEVDSETYQQGYQNYIYAATPAAGYEFVRFEITRTWDVYGESQRSDPTLSVASNPYTSNGSFDVGSAAWYEYKGEWAGIPGYKAHVSSISVVAVFRRILTHLLVNSSTAENPAQLVYYPTTNLLVADF